MLNFFDEQTILYLYQQFKKLFATKEELKKAEAGEAGSGGSGGEGSGLPEVYRPQ